MNNKSTIITVLLSVITAGVIGASIYFWSQMQLNQQQMKINRLENQISKLAISPILAPTSNPLPTDAPLPTTTPKSDGEMIKELIAKLHNNPIDQTNITVSANTGLHASGSVSFSGETGGGIWLAVKQNSQWQVVYDGNGTIPCSSIIPYNFPKTIVSECWDENSETLKQL